MLTVEQAQTWLRPDSRKRPIENLVNELELKSYDYVFGKSGCMS